jgi:hypothetical protein
MPRQLPVVAIVIGPVASMGPPWIIAKSPAPPRPWTIKFIARAPPIAPPAGNPMAVAADPANRFYAVCR